MLKAAIKFCGGCNPRYDRGEAYNKIRQIFENKIIFSLPEDGEKYDVLLIISGCTGCEYSYDEIAADNRLYLNQPEKFEKIVDELNKLYSNK